MTQGNFDSIDAEQDGLRLTKEVEIAGDDVSHVRFTLRSERDGPASVRLVDDVPEAIPDGRVGLHPDHRDRWTVEDRRLVFEADVDPGEEVTTLYGVNTADPDEAAEFLVSPSVSVEGPLDPVAQSDGGTTPDPFESATVAEDDLVGALVADLRDADAERREELRDLLADDSAGGGSVDARLKHLQNSVADLEAYRDALGAFLDEQGGAQAVIEEFEDDVADLREDLARVEGDLDAATERLDDLAELSLTVDELRTTVEDLEETQAAHADRLSNELDGLADEVATLREDIEAGRRWREGVAAAASEVPDASAASLGGAPDPVPDPAAGTEESDDEADDPVADDEDSPGDDEADAEAGPDADENEGAVESEDDPFGPEADAEDPLGDLDDGAEAETDDPLGDVPE